VASDFLGYLDLNTSQDAFPCFGIRNRFDGPSDDEGPVVDASNLPRLSAHSNIASFLRRPLIKTFETISKTNSTGFPRSPDRFLPGRRPTLDSAVESFRANKDPHILSTNEKLLRNKEASPDAFNPRRRVTSPMHVNRLHTRRTFSANRSGGGGMGDHQLNMRQNRLMRFQEQVFLHSSVTLPRRMVSVRLVQICNLFQKYPHDLWLTFRTRTLRGADWHANFPRLVLAPYGQSAVLHPSVRAFLMVEEVYWGVERMPHYTLHRSLLHVRRLRKK